MLEVWMETLIQPGDGLFSGMNSLAAWLRGEQLSLQDMGARSFQTHWVAVFERENTRTLEA